MSTLYELTSEYLEVLDMMEDDSTEEKVIKDTLDSISGEIEDKADNIAKAIKSLKTEAEIIERESKRLTARKKMLLNNADRLKRYLEKSMIATNKRKFKTPLFTFGIRTNQPTLVIDNEKKVPKKYILEQKPKFDNAALKEYLKEHKVTYAHLEASESLQIR